VPTGDIMEKNNKKKKKSRGWNRPGAPSKYTNDLPKRAYRLALLGLSDEDLAVAFGIRVSTLYKWKVRHPDFAEALQKGKTEADSKVALSLYKKATGFVRKEKFFRTSNGELLSAEYSRYYPPDTTAAIYWLKTRQKERWMDVNRTEVTGKNGQPIDINHKVDLSDFTDQELKTLEQIGVKLKSAVADGKRKAS